MKQITSEFDRFYYNAEIKNSRTGTHFFPSVTHILDSAPVPQQLVKWWKNLGHYSTDFMNHASDIGSLVHHCCGEMVKSKFGWSGEKIMEYFYETYGYKLSESDLIFTKRCLMGFMAWNAEMKEKYGKGFKILKSEYQTCSDDYAGTIDLLIEIDEKKITVDLKTSKAIRDNHERQVESYRRSDGADLGATLRLGAERAGLSNYSFDIVKTASKQNKLWAEFQAIKEVFYLTAKAEPTTEEFAELFKL